MVEVVLFVLSFLFAFVVYEVFVVFKAKKYVKNKDDCKQPIEIKYLISKYKFNLKKINYNELLHVCAAVSSFDIALIVTVAMFFDVVWVQIIVIILLVIPVILISYWFVYLIYKKRGLI